MSDVPAELRNIVVRRLEAAVAQRDSELARVQGESRRLRQLVGELEADIGNLQGLHQEAGASLEQLDGELTAEQIRAMAVLDRLNVRMRDQHWRVVAALQEVELRHGADRNALKTEILDLARHREEQARRTRDLAGETTEQAAAVMDGLDAARAEAVDQGGRHRAVLLHLDEVRSTISDAGALPHETLGAAIAVEAAAQRLHGLVVQREESLSSEAVRLEERVADLGTLLDGVSSGDLPDQRQDVTDLLGGECAMLRGVVQREVLARLEALKRWNGHGALVSFLDRLCDQLNGEIVAARRALPAAVLHEERRYCLRHIWRSLEYRFGAIQLRGAETPGAHQNPRNLKSTYFYFLDTDRGEVRVQVPWAGDLEVFLGDARVATYGPIAETSDEARYIGDLGRRWLGLSRDLQVPDRRAWMGSAGGPP